MTTPSKPSATGSHLVARQKASLEVIPLGETALVNVTGLIDEHFAGFKNLGDVKSLVLNVSGMTRMTSFGVRQWLKAMDGIPKSISDVYLLGCPTFFVDQLNMVLNFGGTAQILTVMAPYTCLSCGAESGEVIDVLAERAALAKGGVSEKECARCGGKLEFDETPESYFSFVQKYAATSIQPSAAQALAQRGLYVASVDAGAEKPPKIIKIVHGAVTYFRIRGVIGTMFRARPFLVGAEGEIVIDLAEAEQFDPAGQREWRRLIKTLSAQVPALSLVDVSPSFLANGADSLAIARNVSVWSVMLPFTCGDCGKTSQSSHELEGGTWPLTIAPIVCGTCGGKSQCTIDMALLAPLQKASTSVPSASAKLIRHRAEVLSRALTDANVAQAGEGATSALAADDTILGKYKIVQRLSAGGMAEVFLAKQVGIGGFEKPVALKRIQRQLLENRHLAIDMFLNEAKIAGRLTHPNIVQVLDVGEVGGALYLAMEYVRGKDLRDIVKQLRTDKRTVPIGPALHIVREVAQALHHAYWSLDMAGKRLSVVHRDVSPHNIILGYDGTVKLLDFGVAMSDVTENEAMVVGKWQYMSPEHTTNQLDHRSDLFSLGVVLYLLLSGVMPFHGNDPKEIMRRIKAGQYRPLQEITPVPPALADLVERMLAPQPENRPQTGQEVALLLNDIMRSNRLEASGAEITEFVSELFPYEGFDSATVTEIARQEVSASIQPEPSASSSETLAQGSPMPVPSLSKRLSAVFAPNPSVSRNMPAATGNEPQVTSPAAPATDTETLQGASMNRLWLIGVAVFILVIVVIVLAR